MADEIDHEVDANTKALGYTIVTVQLKLQKQIMMQRDEALKLVSIRNRELNQHSGLDPDVAEMLEIVESMVIDDMENGDILENSPQISTVIQRDTTIMVGPQHPLYDYPRIGMTDSVYTELESHINKQSALKWD